MMSNDLQNNTEGKDILPYILLIAIAGIGFNLYYKYDRYYLKEPLVTKQIVVTEKPAYIYVSKGTSRYAFRGADYNCAFWLSEGALETIRNDDNIKREIESINIGDTIDIRIRQEDEAILREWAANSRVIELIKGNKTIISAAQVQKKDQKTFYINVGIAICCLIIWIIVKVKRSIKKGNEPI